MTIINNKPRADKTLNLDKVAASVAKNPMQTQRQISEDTWLSIWNVNNKLKDVEQYAKNDERIQTLLDGDVLIMEMIQKKKLSRLNVEWTEEVNNKDIDTWENTAVKRRAIFWEKKEWDDRVTFILW